MRKNHNKHKRDCQLSEDLAEELGDFISSRSNEIEMLGRFGAYINEGRYDYDPSDKSSVAWQIIAAAYLFFKTTAALHYGIRTFRESTEVVQSYWTNKHQLYNINEY